MKSTTTLVQWQAENTKRKWKYTENSISSGLLVLTSCSLGSRGHVMFSTRIPIVACNHLSYEKPGVGDVYHIFLQ